MALNRYKTVNMIVVNGEDFESSFWYGPTYKFTVIFTFHLRVG